MKTNMNTTIEDVCKAIETIYLGQVDPLDDSLRTKTRDALTPLYTELAEEAEREKSFQVLPNDEVAIHIPNEYKGKKLWIVSEGLKVELTTPPKD